jgi:hypothetical protein
VATLDLKIREQADIEKYAEAAMSAAYRRHGGQTWLSDIWRRKPDTRERKLQSAIVPYGFTLTEEVNPKYSLSSEFWTRMISLQLDEIEAKLMTF